MVQYKNKDLTVFESSLFRTTSTLIQTEDLILLVDPTWLPNEITAIREHVDFIKNDRPFYLLFTHSDYDHILGYGAFKDATVIGSTAFINNDKKEECIKLITNFDDDYYVRRKYPIVYPTIDYEVKEEGQVLEVGNTKLQFFNAPGHNKDGIITIVEPLGVMIVGDYMSNVEFPYIYHNSRAYDKTLDKIAQLLLEKDIKYLIPGHGDFTDSKPEMDKRLLDSKKYLKNLRYALSEGLEFDFLSLMAQYQFPNTLKRFHETNMQLIRRELGMKV